MAKTRVTDLNLNPAVCDPASNSLAGVIDVRSRIAVSDVEAKEVEVICHDIPELAGIRGLLRLSFLKYFRTVIDYRQGYLEIS